MKKNENQLHLYLRKYFVEYIPVYRKFSAKTERTYKQALDSFRIYQKEINNISFNNLTFEYFDKENIYKYLVYLRDEKGCAINTLNLRLAAIKSFLRYCGEQDIALMHFYTNASTIKNFKGTKKIRVEYLTTSQLKTLFQIPDVHSRLGRRDRFFMIFTYETGARMEEILRIKLKDILISENKTIRIKILGKGNKIRYIPLMDSVVAHLNAYLKEFHPLQNSEEYLFYTVHNHHQTPMTPGAVDAFLKKYAKKLNKEDKSFPLNLHEHMLRHSIAMSMYKNGIPLSYVKDFLGHKNYETTQIYAYADEETIAKALASLSDIKPKVEENKKVNEEEILLQYCGLE